jgi:hypothetical protein
MTLLKEHVFSSEAVPAIASVVEDIDVSTLDPGHVQPKMGLEAWIKSWGSKKQRPKPKV